MTQNAGKIVRARLKPLEEIPEQFMCCDGMRQRFADTLGQVLYALPDTLFEAEIECPCCHRILEDVRYVKLKRQSRIAATCIAVPCYDFDEGVAQ